MPKKPSGIQPGGGVAAPNASMRSVGTAQFAGGGVPMVAAPAMMMPQLSDQDIERIARRLHELRGADSPRSAASPVRVTPTVHRLSEFRTPFRPTDSSPGIETDDEDSSDKKADGSAVSLAADIAAASATEPHGLTGSRHREMPAATVADTAPTPTGTTETTVFDRLSMVGYTEAMPYDPRSPHDLRALRFEATLRDGSTEAVLTFLREVDRYMSASGNERRYPLNLHHHIDGDVQDTLLHFLSADTTGIGMMTGVQWVQALRTYVAASLGSPGAAIAASPLQLRPCGLASDHARLYCIASFKAALYKTLLPYRADQLQTLETQRVLTNAVLRKIPRALASALREYLETKEHKDYTLETLFSRLKTLAVTRRSDGSPGWEESDWNQWFGTDTGLRSGRERPARESRSRVSGAADSPATMKSPGPTSMRTAAYTRESTAGATRASEGVCDHSRHPGGADACWQLHPELKPTGRGAGTTTLARRYGPRAGGNATGGSTKGTTIKGLTDWCNMMSTLPTCIYSDGGTHFDNEQVRAWAVKHNITWKIGTPLNHKAQGLIENRFKHFNQCMRAVLGAKGGSWHKDDLVDSICRTINQLPNSATGMSPHQMLFGCAPRTAVTAYTEAGVPEGIPSGELTEESWSDLVFSRYAMQKALCEMLVGGTNITQLATRHAWDMTHTDQSFNVGDWVLVLYENRRHTLEPYARGPYIVTKRRGDYYDLEHVTDNRQTTSAYVARLTPFDKSRTTVAEERQYALDEGYHIVDSILSHKQGPSGLQFEVKWHNGVITWADGPTLKKIVVFKKYIDEHNIPMSTALKRTSDVDETTPGRRRGRPRMQGK